MTNLLNSILACTSETKLGRDSFNTVRRVNVLDKRDLPASSSTLARGDDRGGQEIFPDLGEVSKRNFFFFFFFLKKKKK